MESVKGGGGETHIHIVSYHYHFQEVVCTETIGANKSKGVHFQKKCRDVEASTYQTKMVIWIR